MHGKSVNKIISSVLILAILGLSGCVSVPAKVNEESLIKLYARQRQQPKKYPVIFIPGVMGTVLKDRRTGQTIWGQAGQRFIDLLALPIDTVTLIVDRDLVAAAPLGKMTVIPGVLEKEIYDKLTRVTVKAGGYEFGKTAFALSYDWRRDLVEAVKALDALITQIKQNSGDPNIKVNLVCHSAGGLIARYYVKYGSKDVLGQDPLPLPDYGGAKNINKVIMLGTPNSGAVEAFQRVHLGLALSVVGYLSPEILFTMPSIYQSFPFERKDIFIDPNGQSLDIDLYDPANWEKYGWSIFEQRKLSKARRGFILRHGRGQGQILFDKQLSLQRRFLAGVLQRAKRFHAALCQGDPETEKKRVDYLLLGSDCHPTLEHALLRLTDTGWKTSFRSLDAKINDSLFGLGDTSVTKDSLLGVVGAYHLPASVEVFVCENHNDLATSTTYLDNALNMLLRD